MSLCHLSKDFLEEGHTFIDNTFIINFMNELDEIQLKTYIYGLYLCAQENSSQNNLQFLCDALSVSKQTISDAFDVLASYSLVTICSFEPLSLRFEKFRPTNFVRKFKKEKYEDFNEQFNSIFPSNAQINPNIFLIYYDFMEEYKVSPEVMIMVIRYCVSKKGEKISPNYILTVAKNWISEGVRSVEEVDFKIRQMETVTESLIMIARELGKKSELSIEDRQLYLKWTKSWGFDLQPILLAAKLCNKRGGMKRLDTLLDELFRMGCLSSIDIQTYTDNKQKLVDNAIQVNKKLGVWYDNVDFIIEKYISPWLAKGFDFDAIQLIAEYCFRTSIRTLEGMNNAVNKFYKHGCLSTDSINEYLNTLVAVDDKIKSLILASGSSRSVSKNDRDLYKIWSIDWGINFDIIHYACTLAVGKPYGFGFINNLLSKWKNNNVTSLEQAKNQSNLEFSTNNISAKAVATFNANDKKYSQSELSAFFDNVNDLDDIEV